MNNIYLGLNCEKVSKKLSSDFAGVGLIRSEYLCRNIEEYVTLKSCRDYIYNYVDNICKIFTGKDVWYRFTDLTTNEIDTLDGCDHFIKEKFHFMGTKGVRRHLLDLNTFKLEAELISKLSHSNANLGVVIPYISELEEFIKVKEILDEFNYHGKIAIMVEIPATIFLIDKFIELGVDGFIVGMNDLTTLMLSATRETVYHDKNNPVLMKIIKDLQEKCKKNNREFMVAGYFDESTIMNLLSINDLKIVVNYANLPNLNKKYKNIRYLNYLSKIKKVTREKRNKIGE